MISKSNGQSKYKTKPKCYKCVKCEKEFAQFASAQNYCRKQVKVVSCPICDGEISEISDKKNLKRHILKTHEKEKETSQRHPEMYRV